MRTVILEDNDLDSEHLRILLESFSEVEVIGHATSLPEGLDLIRSSRPELVMLDVQIGGGNSLEWMNDLEPRPAIICTTLFETYALKAFDVGVLDYLIKPVTRQKLERALSRYADRSKVETLDIKCGKTLRRVRMDSILYIRGERDYTEVEIDGETLLCGTRMREWQERLPAEFLGLDRSLIINRDRVESFTPATRNAKGRICFPGGGEVRIGFTASKRFQHQLP